MNRTIREYPKWDHRESFAEAMADQLKGAPWLLVSLAVHALAVFLLWNIPWEAPRFSVDQQMAVEAVREDVETPPEEPPPEEIPAPEEAPQEKPEIQDTRAEEEEEFADLTDLDPSNSLPPSPFQEAGFNPVIGLGGGGGGGGGSDWCGPWRNRHPGRKPFPGVVRRALDWLARHQDDDGKWDADGFMSHCKGPRCTGPGSPIHDVGLTGLALLAFLGDGNTLRVGRYKENVKRGILWLKDQQDDEGLIGEKVGRSFMYSHIIAATALCEAYGLSRFRLLRRPVQKAVDYISNARNPYKAWRYYPRSGDNDSSVTGWAVIALASARSFEDTGLKVSEDDFKGAIAWYDQMTDPNTGRVGYITRGSLPARPEELMDRFPAAKSESITAVALLARFFAGQDPRRDPVMIQHARLIAKKPPVWNPKDGSIDMYYWYYGSYALFQMGGSYWKGWNRKMKAAVVDSQIREKGCARGSWDPVGVWGREGGRVYSTAIMALCLEVYYRYSRLILAGR